MQTYTPEFQQTLLQQLEAMTIVLDGITSNLVEMTESVRSDLAEIETTFSSCTPTIQEMDADQGR